MDIPVIREIIGETANLLEEVAKNPNEVPDIILDKMLSNVYRLTYEIVLSNLRGVTVITSSTKSIFSTMIGEGVVMESQDSRFSSMEYNIYKILYILKAMDIESYSVIFKVL